MKTIKAIAAGLTMLCAILTFTAPASASGGVSPKSPRLERAKVPLRVSVAPRQVQTGRTIRVAGGSGSRKPGRVKLLFRRSGSRHWHPVKAVKADHKGRFKTRVRAKSSGALRTAVAGGQFSDAHRIRVRSRLKVRLSRHRIKLGRSTLIRGAVKPAGRRWIKITIRGADHRIIKVRTRPNGGFKVRWKPRRAGNVRMRVRSADNKVAIGDHSRRIRVMGLRPVQASYFGPGLYGNGVACGGTLRPGTLGVANKTLPCGTRVTLSLHGRSVTVPVIDRGPYVGNREYDLTTATKQRLGFVGLGTVWTNR